MPSVDKKMRAAELEQLGRFIIREYNRVTGIWAYDPQGFYQDIYGQVDRIFAPELNAIKEAARAERERLYSVEFRILCLEFELAMEKKKNWAYERLFDLQKDIRSRLMEGDKAGVDRDVDEIIYEIRDGIRESMEIPLKAFNLSFAERKAKFEEWRERNYF